MRRRDPAFCFGIAGIAKAPWRPSIKEAQADAEEAGYATKEPWSKTYYMLVPGEIWTTHDLVPAVPRGPAFAPSPSNDPYAGMSRIDRIIARREGKVASR